MSENTPLIAAISIGFVLALVFGGISNRLRISPIVGYLLAGLCVGPYTPFFVADAKLYHEISEIGVILLMFGVGLHFSIKDLLSVKNIAIPGAIGQISIATLMGMGLAWCLGWSLGEGLIFGLALSVASTVVLLRALESRQLIDSRRGKIAVGWLIVEDLVMVLALVLLPALSGLLVTNDPATATELTGAATSAPEQINIVYQLLITLGKVTAFIAFMVIFGRRFIPWILERVAMMGSRELFTLSVLAIAMGIAFGSAVLFGVSFALGAFFAGMVLNESELSHKAAQDSLPFRDAFAVLFFVSVGMLFDPKVLIAHPFLVLATFFIIAIGKSIAAFLIVLAFRKPVITALTIAASLAQIGEFSFILASLGMSYNLLPKDGYDLILAGAILSILLNPVFFLLVDRMDTKVLIEQDQDPIETSELEPLVEIEEDIIQPIEETNHAILVGFSAAGRIIGHNLHKAGVPFVVIDDTHANVNASRENKFTTIEGNAANIQILLRANLESARWLLINISNNFEAAQISQQAKQYNPSLMVIVRAHLDAEKEHLEKNGVDLVVIGDYEVASAMEYEILYPEVQHAPADGSI